MYQVYASVLIITRNKPERLEITLQSLVNQEATEAPFEVVIIDDGSDIDLRVITDKFVNHLAIQYIKMVHQGIAVARNRFFVYWISTSKRFLSASYSR
ncbi:glycosyltransferase family 2 protein [Photorhabdus sp. RW14-46]|uniref:glycosyltransferase family 2 protein n=1 Tax=Photorhabdus sp. RW14-46 TaxID=2100168 RepID=UPI0013F4A917|nr:glycosyltransferase [Photorhabdus sp. RW14-46]NHB60904.1 hypothetical protein [Photorhabdus sp. RW14-46]